MRNVLICSLLILGVALMGMGCDVSEMREVQGTGTIQYVDLSGGFYGIAADDGAAYDPVNLPSEYEVDGLHIRFEGKVRSDIAGIHMWGTVLELTSLQKLE